MVIGAWMPLLAQEADVLAGTITIGIYQGQYGYGKPYPPNPGVGSLTGEVEPFIDAILWYNEGGVSNGAAYSTELMPAGATITIGGITEAFGSYPDFYPYYVAPLTISPPLPTSGTIDFYIKLPTS